MGKKSADRKRERDKAFKIGQVKTRERFVNKKFALMEELLSNEKKKEQLMAKPIAELDKIEKAAVFSLSMKPVTLEDFSAKKEELKKAEVTSAKHKFGVK